MYPHSLLLACNGVQLNFVTQGPYSKNVGFMQFDHLITKVATIDVHADDYAMMDAMVAKMLFFPHGVV